jgi:hypothetical protein
LLLRLANYIKVIEQVGLDLSSIMAVFCNFDAGRYAERIVAYNCLQTNALDGKLLTRLSLFQKNAFQTKTKAHQPKSKIQSGQTKWHYKPSNNTSPSTNPRELQAKSSKHAM